MANLMSTKLDSTNYMIWKLQISAILEAYSMIDHLDSSNPPPSPFLFTDAGTQSANPPFLIWKKRDKALLTLLYSTLSSPVLSMVVGLSTSLEVWNTLEERFTSTARANVLNLKMELQSVRKGNESITTYLQRVKTVSDKLSAVEKLSVLLQTEEQSMQEASDPLTNSALAMFVSHNKPSNNYSGNHGYTRGGRGRNSFSRGLHAKSVGSKAIMLLIATTEWILLTKAKIQQPSLLQWPVPLTFIILSQLRLGSQILVHLTTSQPLLPTLNSQSPYQGQDQVSVGNGQHLPIQNIGNANLHTKLHKFQLRNVLHVPRIASNLISVHKLCLNNNCSCYFDANKLLIQDLPTGRLLYQGLSRNGVYPIHSSSTLFNSASNKTACAVHSVTPDKWQLWHSRLGHPSSKVLSSVFPSLQCKSVLSDTTKVHCTHCLAGKMHQLPFPVSNKTVTSPFALVHADLWGPAPVLSSVGFRFYLVLVDEFTKFTWVYLLKHKSDTFKVFTQFQAMVNTQFSLPIKILRSDCGGEFTSTDFTQFCHDKGILHHLSCPHTPQQNGVAERKHRTFNSIYPKQHETTTASCYTSNADKKQKWHILNQKLVLQLMLIIVSLSPLPILLPLNTVSGVMQCMKNFQALQKQGTWSLVPKPPFKNIVGCKWVYKLKYNSDGTIARHKARLVAKGFHQQYGIDFDETFSPVVKPPTVRLILSLAVSLNWPLRQLDVKNAFLHGTLKEEVYMTQPQGYVDPTHPTHVCKLIKSIYGLKQAPRAWFESFTSQLLHLGFIASTADSSPIHIQTPQDCCIPFTLFFDLKGLGTSALLLGTSSELGAPSGLFLNQAKYATGSSPKSTNMLDSKPAKSPSCPNTRLSLHEGDLLTDPHGYRSLVGGLHYLTFTRPDISFSVHQVCQYMSAPTTVHLAAAKRILRYIRGTLFHGVAFTPGPLHLSAFTDADWAGDPDDRDLPRDF
uniref:Integrase catalytic domain-containing protein n=1 Tax=Fagus sylvatica TaxID=28930 RepID=A0A2N9IRZ8_FAGSY